ncbi:MAG: methyltransferase [Methylophaga sp.]|nr:methyltransferase [Methylophaga sp.]
MPKPLKSLLLSISLLISISPTVFADESLHNIINSDQRDAENVARDSHRHPYATLQFFGITADMQMAEIWPGRGWYTEILAPWLKQGDGKLIAAGFPADMGPQWRMNLRQTYNDWLTANPERFDQVEVVEFGPGHWHIAKDDSLDAVLTFRNVHNWVQGDVAEQAFGAMFKALKPGGMLGVTDHRAKPGTDLATMKKSGYVTEALVITFAEQAGFQLAAKSEINANPADTVDHPNGVWTLLPTLRIDDAQKAHYQQIGESDRMTLKFVKPK